MKKQELFYKSLDGVTTIHAIEWIPDRDIKGILQICHGMKEYIDRYDGFASYCADNGYLVVGNDHLGHGLSLTDEKNRGYFADRNGNKCLINDVHTLRTMIQKDYPQLPYFLMGHSMGSFIVRQYITEYGYGINGTIIMGTGYFTDAKLLSGMQLCRMRAMRKGWHYRSKFMAGLSEGAYNSRFGEKGGNQWLTRDTAVVEVYNANPLNSFVFTLNGYYNMYYGMRIIGKNESLKKMDKSMPVLFISGAEDPVGDYGNGVRKVYNRFKSIGMKNVTLKLFEGDRHEILNESDKEQVYTYLLKWFEEHCNR